MKFVELTTGGKFIKISSIEDYNEYVKSQNRDLRLSKSLEELECCVIEGKSHCGDRLANQSLAYAKSTGIPIIESFFACARKFNETYKKAYIAIINSLNGGDLIFINKRGGWFNGDESIILREIDSIDEQPRFISWPKGRHIYVKFGNDDVIVDGKQKWNTIEEATKAYDKWKTSQIKTLI